MQATGGHPFLMLNLWRFFYFLCISYLHARQLRVTVGDWGHCCCTSVTYFECSLIPLCWFCTSALGLILFQICSSPIERKRHLSSFVFIRIIISPYDAWKRGLHLTFANILNCLIKISFLFLTIFVSSSCFIFKLVYLFSQYFILRYYLIIRLSLTGHERSRACV